MDKKKIIMLKEQGLSNREVARQTGHDRDTVSKYWNEYRGQLCRLDEPGADVRAIQESLLAQPKYNGRNRKRHKYTEKVEKRLKEILKEEERADAMCLANRCRKRLYSKSALAWNNFSALLQKCSSALFMQSTAGLNIVT